MTKVILSQQYIIIIREKVLMWYKEDLLLPNNTEASRIILEASSPACSHVVLWIVEGKFF